MEILWSNSRLLTAGGSTIKQIIVINKFDRKFIGKLLCVTDNMTCDK